MDSPSCTRRSVAAIAALPLSVLLALSCAVIAAGCLARPAPAPAAPTAPPVDPAVAADARGAIEQWRQAFEVKSEAALAQRYAHDPSLVVALDGNLWQGWPAVEAALRARLARASEIKVRLRDLDVVSLGPDAASAVAIMTREATSEATTVTENGVVTLVLRKTPAGWVIVAEHYSYKRP